MLEHTQKYQSRRRGERGGNDSLRNMGSEGAGAEKATTTTTTNYYHYSI